MLREKLGNVGGIPELPRMYTILIVICIDTIIMLDSPTVPTPFMEDNCRLYMKKSVGR